MNCEEKMFNFTVNTFAADVPALLGTEASAGKWPCSGLVYV